MYIKLSSINNSLSENAGAFIKECELTYYNSIKHIADEIIREKGARPVILISGPSGSGKTTSAKFLESILDSAGLETHTLSIDNFFHSMTEQEKELHRQNKMDLESPDRVDSQLLTKTLTDIINGAPVCLPRFDFPTNTRSFECTPLVRKPNELIILEGTHALNPNVVGINESKLITIYVSVRTRVKTEDGALIHPEYIRLMRRMLRDNKFRGRSYTETARMYKSVQDGESKYIMPYKHRAMYDIDTFIPYELSVYRDLIFKGLMSEGLDKRIPQLESLLAPVIPLCASAVPDKSLLHEFLG